MNSNFGNLLIANMSVCLSVCLDIALAHPWSKDTIKGATKEGGYAAAKREVKKITKYNNMMAQNHI